MNIFTENWCLRLILFWECIRCCCETDSDARKMAWLFRFIPSSLLPETENLKYIPLILDFSSRYSHHGIRSIDPPYIYTKVIPSHLSSHSISFNTSNVGNFWILKDCIKVQQKKRKVVALCSPSSTKREIRHLHVVVVQRRLRNVQKKRDARANFDVLPIQPIAFFLPFSLPSLSSLLKLHNNTKRIITNQS